MLLMSQKIVTFGQKLQLDFLKINSMWFCFTSSTVTLVYYNSLASCSASCRQVLGT